MPTPTSEIPQEKQNIGSVPTPGRWEVTGPYSQAQQFANGPVWIVIAQDGSRLICEAYTAANAAAIAALPDALTALRHLRAALNCHYDWRTIEHEYGAEIDAALAVMGGAPK